MGGFMKEKAKIIIEENKNILFKKEEAAYNLYINHYNPANGVFKLAHALNIKTDQFIYYVCSYINKYVQKPIYAIVLDKLITIDNNNDVIAYLDSINLPISYIEDNLIPYIIYYNPKTFLHNDNKLLISLRKKINLYKQYLKNEDIPKSQNQNTTKYSLAKEIITKFISSNYTIERFCLHERIGCQVFKEHVQTLKTESKNQKKENRNEDFITLYDIYLNCLNNKDEIFKNTIVDDVHIIFNKIKELENDFCSIDVFANTLFGIHEILKFADNILNMEEAKLFRSCVSKYKKVSSFSPKVIETLFHDTITINIDNELILIDNTTKSIIIDYLQENNIPICNDSFRNACIRYYQEKLYPSKHR